MTVDARLLLTIPADGIEPSAMSQIEQALALPFLKKLAIMPDVHAGYDLPVGGVALLDGYIWPGAVGYDIGCGMCHISTGVHVSDIPPAESIFEGIMGRIPVGFSSRTTPLTHRKFGNASGYACLGDAVRERASRQLGALGGGNHFIEVGVNAEGMVGITIHSGSRRPGWIIADFYMRMTGGPVPVDSEIGQKYLADMEWAQMFALDNRAEMMRQCLWALHLRQDLVENMINENHNHAVLTDDGVLHRKGATPAEFGKLGIIPANMRDGVWITRGLGNEKFLCSASHGAGRRMSRTEAKKRVDMVKFADDMRGVVTPDLSGISDEHPEAYKPIGDVLSAQDGVLVDIVDHFKPIVVVKG